MMTSLTHTHKHTPTCKVSEVLGLWLVSVADGLNSTAKKKQSHQKAELLFNLFSVFLCFSDCSPPSLSVSFFFFISPSVQFSLSDGAYYKGSLAKLGLPLESRSLTPTMTQDRLPPKTKTIDALNVIGFICKFRACPQRWRANRRFFCTAALPQQNNSVNKKKPGDVDVINLEQNAPAL